MVEAENRISSLETDLQVAEINISELGKNLSESLDKAKTRGVEERKIKTELRETLMKMERYKSKNKAEA